MAWVRHLAAGMREERQRDAAQQQPGGDGAVAAPAAAAGPSAAATTTTTCCIVAGDVSDDLRVLRLTFQALQEAFDVVAFVPGNHSQWVKEDKPSSSSSNTNGSSGGGSSSSSSNSSVSSLDSRNGGATDSVAKLRAVMRLCDECGVSRQPVRLGGLLLAPVLSWHHKSFDREPDIPGIPRAGAMTIADYAACRWPPGMPGATELGAEATAEWLDAANESEMQQPGWAMLERALAGRSRPGSSSSGSSGPDDGGSAGHTAPDLVTFSHFLPLQDLLPEKRMLTYPNLAKAVGSDFLWRRLQRLRPHLHVFGHSHFAWDACCHGIRFLQAPLCYPGERLHRMRSIVLHTQEEHEALQQQQQQQQADGASSSNSSSSGDGSGTTPPGAKQRSIRALRQQHRHRRHGHSHGAACCATPWLPVNIYNATYTASLTHQQHQQQQQRQACTAQASAAASTAASGGSGTRHWLKAHGVPVLHGSELHGQQQHEGGSAAGQCYRITGWDASWCEQLHALWSDYYAANARQPGNTQLAPWVEKRYRRHSGRAQPPQQSSP